MLRDVFYYGKKPNTHPKEKFAKSLDDARQQCTTEHFWIINEYCDYTKFDWEFDFDFMPDEDVWASEHNNVWPSYHQKDSGTWLCSKQPSEIVIYRADVNPIKRKIVEYNWIITDKLIDKSKFDLSWHPDPTSPPYIYTWGNKYVPAEIKPTLEYHIPGATDRKYMSELVELLPDSERWVTVQQVNNFDYTWRPDPREPAYIYTWGNKHIPAEVEPTLEYHCPGATERKYMTELVELTPQMDKWVEIQAVDKNSFDYTWTPDPREPAYIYTWGNKHIPAEVKPTLEYHCEGATERKYMNNDLILLPDMDKWVEVQPVNKSSFDFSWRPDPREPSFIYVWGNKYIPAEVEPTLEYHCPGATERKYMTELVEVIPHWNKWIEVQPVNKSSFDFSWRPNPTSPPYIYVWGNKYIPAEVEPTLEYHCPGATERKYMTELVEVMPHWNNWIEVQPVNKSSFDFSWRPNPTSPPYIYTWGNKFIPAEVEPTLEYFCIGATERKYMTELVEVMPKWDKWTNLEYIDYTSFDFSWRPDPTMPPYKYQFGTQWQKTNGPTYVVDGATEIKYVDSPTAIVKANMTNWVIPKGFDIESFDFSWHPDSASPPYIYQFGTLLDDVHLEDGPKYVTPSNIGQVVLLENIIASSENIKYPKYYIETTLDDLIEQHKDEIFWALRKNIDYNKFNFDWKPTKQQVFNINTFGSSESETTQTYLVNGKLWQKGHRDISFIENTSLDETYLSTLFKPVDMFFIDKSNSDSAKRYEQLKQRFPTIQKTRYVNSWVDSINRCINKSTTDLCWILNSELDYSNFDFNYYPNPWQMTMVHVFGTQWTHWGTTFMVNKETFSEDTKYVKVIEHLSNINFVKTKRAIASNCLYDIYLIDYGNEGVDKTVQLLEHKTKRTVDTIKYESDYLTTLKNLLYELGIKNNHYVWVCSSICDYSTFDFTYICDPFSLEQLHVFPSDKQNYGDTFFINVNKLRTLVEDLDKLENIEKINFNQHQKVKRLPAPTYITESDTHVSITNIDYNWPYATFITSDNKEISTIDYEPISLWSTEKNILITSTGGTRIDVPKEAKNYVEKELYDYPYISTSSKLTQSNPLDIVFLSNGETGADENYEHLLNVTKDLPNRVVRVDGVNGRVQAYHAAAEASNTPWMFTVFAKLKVNSKFDWSWQPDRLQIPKHYIFYASNPVNGLVYGHQAMIAYNKSITLNNMGKGLDFTLDNEHEVVEINSGVAYYNTDEFSTWRTSFRECIKLRLENSTISKHRLKKWSTVGEGQYGEYSTKGAVDAVEYFNSVDGDITKLRLSYEWVWLQEYYNNKYSN